ncbi:MAG TPA: carboxypeptidase-like regulatory domain-containing protein [Amycolatopsis sp.]|nr:carboxypeptidase-like regulatory domain-containing protein [Amycolatopsis sp.]
MTQDGIPQQNRRGSAISGRVHDAGGAPVPGAALTLVDATGRQIARGTTEGAGGFTLAAPGRGSYVLITSAPAYQPEAVTVNVVDTAVTVEITLRAASGLRGVVRGAETGVPIMDAAVTLTNAQGDVVDSRLSGQSGDYTFAALPPGAYTLAVNARNYRPTALTVTVGEASPTTQDVELADGAVIQGSVRLPAGEPHPKITVTLLDQGGVVVRTTPADETGRYAFHDLDPGSFTVVATSYPPSRQPVHIGHEERTELAIQLA